MTWLQQMIVSHILTIKEYPWHIFSIDIQIRLLAFFFILNDKDYGLQDYIYKAKLNFHAIVSYKFFWKIFIYYHTSVLIITKSRLRSSISLDDENFSFKPKNRIVINFELVCDVVWVAVFCSKLSENDGRLYLTYSLLVYCTFTRFTPFFVNN